MAITHSVTSAPIDLADWNAAHVGNSLGWYNVRDYGAVGDGSTDDTTALLAALDAAFAAPGGTMYLPPGDYKVTAVITPTSTDSGEVRIMGGGRPQSFLDGTNGDPTAKQGAVIRTTSTTADVIKFAPATNKRVLVTISNLTVAGNSAGTTGHGIHFDGSAGSILPTLQNVSVIGAKQHGVFYDGGVFESAWYDVRVDDCGGTGFKAALNGNLPGETRLYGCVFNVCDVGIDLAGGGHFALFGVSSSYNVNEGIKANGVGLVIDDLHMEANDAGGSSAASKAVFTSLRAPVINGITTGCDTGDTGIGLEFASCIGVTVNRAYFESTSAGAGYRDFSFATSSRCTMNGYMNNDDVDRFALGTEGGNVVHRGNSWQSAQHHALQEISSAVDGTDDPNLILYDTFVSKRTASGKTRNIRFPTNWNDGYRNGHRVTFFIYNASGGATTTTWDSFWGLSGAWTDPGAGKMRSISFEYTGYGYVETTRTTADATPAF